MPDESLMVPNPAIEASTACLLALSIGSIIVPFAGSYIESYKVIPKRNYYGASGYPEEISAPPAAFVLDPEKLLDATRFWKELIPPVGLSKTWRQKPVSVGHHYDLGSIPSSRDPESHHRLKE